MASTFGTGFKYAILECPNGKENVENISNIDNNLFSNVNGIRRPMDPMEGIKPGCYTKLQIKSRAEVLKTKIDNLNAEINTMDKLSSRSHFLSILYKDLEYMTRMRESLSNISSQMTPSQIVIIAFN